MPNDSDKLTNTHINIAVEMTTVNIHALPNNEFITDNIPLELQKIPRWVAWMPDFTDYELKGRVGKVPVYVYKNEQGQLKWRKADHLGGDVMPFEYTVAFKFYWDSAYANYQNTGKVDALKYPVGLGFSLVKSLGLVGLDFDHCIDENGELSEDVAGWLTKFGSYAEVSPSGTGIRVFIKGTLPDNCRKRIPSLQAEIYCEGRFLTVTGNSLEDLPVTIMPAEDALAEFIETYGLVEDTTLTQQTVATNVIQMPVSPLRIKRLKQTAAGGRNGKKFLALFNGDYGKLYDSASEADLALARILAYWGGQDITLIQATMETSKLRRDKWYVKHNGPENDIYIIHTIKRAIAEEMVKRGLERGELNGESVGDAIHDGIPHAAMTLEEELEIMQAFTDLGFMSRFAEVTDGNVILCPELQQWYEWTGVYWRELSQAEWMSYYIRTIEHIKELADVDGASPAFIKAVRGWHKSIQSNTKFKAMYTTSAFSQQLSVSSALFEGGHMLLNVDNGTLNLKTGELCPPRKEDYCTHCIPWSFVPDATCPNWEEFLDIICGKDKVFRDYLQLMVGIWITDVLIKQFFFLYGIGSTGKSKFVDTITALLGDLPLACPIPMGAFMQERGNTDDAQSKALGNAIFSRLVHSPEVRRGMVFDEAVVKRLTGGDRVFARKLYKDAISFVPKYKIVIHGNNRPRISGGDKATLDRIVIVPFTNVIPPEIQDPDVVRNKFIPEMSGILNWALRGAMKWASMDFVIPPVPKVIEDERIEYAHDFDTVGQFLEECCFTRSGGDVGVVEVYAVFKYWAKEEMGLNVVMSRNAFTKELEQRGFAKVRKSDGYRICGVGIMDAYIKEIQVSWGN